MGEGKHSLDTQNRSDTCDSVRVLDCYLFQTNAPNPKCFQLAGCSLVGGYFSFWSALLKDLALETVSMKIRNDIFTVKKTTKNKQQ